MMLLVTVPIIIFIFRFKVVWYKLILDFNN
jgi:hypothetical protein